MTKQHHILNFISSIRDSHPTMVDIYTKGSCLHFHLTLKKMFPEAKMWYNGVECHVITEIDGKFYDITGRVKKGAAVPYFGLWKNPSSLTKQLLRVK